MSDIYKELIGIKRYGNDVFFSDDRIKEILESGIRVLTEQLLVKKK